MKNLENFNSKYQTKATQSDVKGVLKFLVGADAETDSLIDDAMEVGRSVIFNRYPPYSGAYFVSQPAAICQNNIECMGEGFSRKDQQ